MSIKKYNKEIKGRKDTIKHSMTVDDNTEDRPRAERLFDLKAINLSPGRRKRFEERWAIDSRSPRSVEEHRDLSKDVLHQATKMLKDFDDGLWDVYKSSFLGKIRKYVINLLLPDGFVVGHKDSLYKEALAERETRRAEKARLLAEGIKGAWDKIDNRPAIKQVLVLPVEETEGDE